MAAAEASADTAGVQSAGQHARRLAELQAACTAAAGKLQAATVDGDLLRGQLQEAHAQVGG